MPDANPNPNPILDRPDTFEYDDIDPATRFLRANPDLRYHSDRNSDRNIYGNRNRCTDRNGYPG